MFLLSLALVANCQLLAPTFPDEYTAVMILRLPYINMEMPIKVVSTADRQRVEYYDGLEVDIKDVVGGEYKYVFRGQERTCLINEGEHLTAFRGVGLGFLPDLSQYKYQRDVPIGGIMCQKWILDITRGPHGTMDDHIAFYFDPVMQKPVRWHMHARNVVMDSHTDEYILEYLSYDEGAVTPAIPELCTKNPVRSSISHLADGLLLGVRPLENFNHFDMFAAMRGKHYSAQESLKRRTLFAQNAELITRLNKKYEGRTTFRGNQYLDMSVDEVLKFRGGRKPRTKQLFTDMHKVSNNVRPASFDWRDVPGVVGRVKDQGVCGSCWTYSLIHSIESIQSIQTGKLTELPEQFVLDCAWSETSYACDGGLSDDGAYTIINKHAGLVPSARAYGSYLSVDGYCKDTRLMEVGAKVVGYKHIAPRDEDAMLDALYTVGPLAIGIAVPQEMMYYESGVLDVDSCTSRDIVHAVNLVGYGSQDGVPYFTVRNSWSEFWGDKGYIKVIRGEKDCAVSSDTGYPVIETRNAASIVV